jgi:ribonucleoside-diphosphate reductase beta chain
VIAARGRNWLAGQIRGRVWNNQADGRLISLGEEATMARNGTGNGEQRAALRRMADSDPELAVRLIAQTLPAAAAELRPPLSFRLEIDGVDTWLVEATEEGPARVTPNGTDGATPGRGAEDLAHLADADFALHTDAASFAHLAAGSSPLVLLLSRRLRLSGKRRRALALRRLSDDAGPRELARLGLPVNPDLTYRSLAHAVDPEWTRGHSFSVAYELTGEGGGRWVVTVDDGSVRVDSAAGDADGSPDATVSLSAETWQRLVRGEITPSRAMQLQLTRVDGAMTPVTLLGRWIDRAAGIDGPELERERRQRELQRARAGSWGSKANGAVAKGSASDAPGMGDPAHGSERRRQRGDLLTYEELYALWERSNWRAHELDFSVDREQWLISPSEGQKHTAWTLSSFYVGEERVTADLAPFLLAAPSGEVEAFLATQLVDEMRHAVFFDRFAGEVMTMSANDLRGRLEEAEEGMLDAWRFLFDEELRGVAKRLIKHPDHLGLFVEGIVIYHMVTEGVLAMTGQRTILDYLEEHQLYPGFQEGFSKVEQDEHRHIAFGVRFLRDVCEERPEMRQVVLDTLTRLLPRAAEVFAPPEAETTREFVSYAYHSSQVYGHAYMALKRRMKAIGLEIPPPEQLMPGPIDPEGLEGRREPAAAEPATSPA